MNMLAEVSFQETTERLGRSDFIGTYHSNGYGQSEAKQVERERVMKFILSYFSRESDFLRLLSLPGFDWTFEQMLQSERRRVQFVGLERSCSAYARSRRAICRGLFSESVERAQLQDRTIPYGRGNVVYSRIAANGKRNGKCGTRSTRSNRLLLMDSATYTSMLVTDYGASMQEKKEFVDKFYRRSAVWLDFTSQLCNGVEQTLRWLPLCLDHYREAVPVVVTVMNARDAYCGAQSRIERICEVQPEFAPIDHWTYVGKGGTSMLTVCGEIRR